MNKSEDVVFKLEQFKKHIMMCMLFLAFIDLICSIVCFGILFLMRNNDKESISNEIFKRSLNSVVEVKAYTEDVGESFGTAEFIDSNGTAMSEPIAEGISQVVDKTTKAILEITYKGVTYASSVLTAIDRDFAISIMAANTSVSVYTYYESNARSIAQEAGNHKSPIWERHHDYGYFDHYHLGNLSQKGETYIDCHSHAFYGLPQFN